MFISDSETFKKWYQGKGFKNLTEMEANKVEEYRKGGIDLNGKDKLGAKKEILADFVGEMLFGGENQISDNLFSELDDNHKKTFREWISALIDRLKTLFKGNKTAENEITKLEAKFKEMLKESLKSEAKGEKSTAFSFSGWTSDGVEVYNTSPDIMQMSLNKRIEKFRNDFLQQFKGRTAKFKRNGHIYYARFVENKNGLGKFAYEGDSKKSKSDESGYKAKIRLLANGDIFNIVEDGNYSGSKTELGKTTDSHKHAKYWDYFWKEIYVDGKGYDVVINIRNDSQSGNLSDKIQFVYSVSFSQNKKVATPVTTPAKEKQASVKVGVTTYTDSVHQKNDVVNPSDEKTSKNSGESFSYTPADEQELTRMARDGEISAEEYGRRMLEMKESKSVDDIYAIARMSPEDLTTTPDIDRRKGEAKGDGESKFKQIMKVLYAIRDLYSY